jgi:hypothetical protein
MMVLVAMRDANRNPRRWVDESGRVRVTEGWHPSQPSQLGYNLNLDDEWIGTFGTLDGAANAAATHVSFLGLNIQDGRVPLTLVPDP